MNGRRSAPGLVALAAVWGAADLAYSLYFLASEPAGVHRRMIAWLPYARQAMLISAVIGIIVGGALLVGAFMTHHGARAGLLVLLAAIVLYSLSGITYMVWGLYHHVLIGVAGFRYFVATGCTSFIIGVVFVIVIVRARRRFGPPADAREPSAAALPTLPPLPTLTSVAQELERLGVLHDRGLLTVDEYRQAKAKLLA